MHQSSSTSQECQLEFYQIIRPVFERFPKAKPPLDYFLLEESVGKVHLLHRKDTFLSKQAYGELEKYCQQGNLLVSRDDHDIYVDYISQQLRLVLLDFNLQPREVADVFIRGLGVTLEKFFDQPLRENLQLVLDDSEVLARYVLREPTVLNYMLDKREREHNLVNHSVNACIIGLGILLKTTQISRTDFLSEFIAGLLLHDLGVTKIPGFVTAKRGRLQFQEMENVRRHPLLGLKMLKDMGVASRFIRECVTDHHERLDGGGYPRKLSGSKIGKLARITALADSYAAMTSERPHAEAKQEDSSAHILCRDAGYDRKLARSLLSFVLAGIPESEPGRAD